MDQMYRWIHSAQMVGSLSNLPHGQRVGAVVACVEALGGWDRTRVLETASYFGLASQPAFHNGTCSVHLAESPQYHPASLVSENPAEPPGEAWLTLPGFGTSPQLLPLLLNPSLEGLGLVPLTHDPSRIAPIEGPEFPVAILADPDTELALAIPAQTLGVILRYGIKPYAWRTSGLPAVAFEMYAVNGERKTRIWQRSMDPRLRRRDRGVQESVVPVPPDTRQLILATTSSDRSLSHRAYWAGIEFRR
jgi:hypothetical protein